MLAEFSNAFPDCNFCHRGCLHRGRGCRRLHWGDRCHGVWFMRHGNKSIATRAIEARPIILYTQMYDGARLRFRSRQMRLGRRFSMLFSAHDRKQSSIIVRLVTSALMLSASCTLALSDSLSGQASVIDGDTLEIHGTRVRLWGIDAPESTQLCRGEDSERY